MDNTLNKEEVGFSVDPKTDCPHLNHNFASNRAEIPKLGCRDCSSPQENWLCLSCYNAYCGRYINGHGVQHFEETHHAICVSYADLSFWCHECASYITSPLLGQIFTDMHKEKFGVEPGRAVTTPEERQITFELLSGKRPREEAVQQLMASNNNNNNNKSEQIEDDDATQEMTDTEDDGKSKTKNNAPSWWIEGLDESILQNKVVDGLLGCIYGNALGDAVGLSTEFMDKKTISGLYPGDVPVPFPDFLRSMHSARWEKGDWTDDTDQMILILEMLIETKGTVDALLFAHKLKDWVSKGFPELGDKGGMGLGATVGQVVRHSKFRINPHEAAHDVWKQLNENAAANGAVMRTSILGCWQYENLEKVIENTLEICKVTHVDTRCLASCVATTVAISLMLQHRRDNPNQATIDDKTIKHIIDKSNEFGLKYLDKKYRKEFATFLIRESTTKTLEKMQLDEKNSIGYTFKCFGSGFWGLTSTKTFMQTINELVKEGGDSDTNGAVCGALLGTRIGYSQLPKHWLSSLLHKKWLDKKVVEFLKLSKLI